MTQPISGARVKPIMWDNVGGFTRGQPTFAKSFATLFRGITGIILSYVDPRCAREKDIPGSPDAEPSLHLVLRVSRANYSCGSHLWTVVGTCACVRGEPVVLIDKMVRGDNTLHPIHLLA